MNARLALASFWVPGFVRRKRLRDLLRRSADAFGVPAPDVAGMKYDECLRGFAAFTAEQSETAYAADLAGRTSAHTDAVRSRLRVRAYELGREIARTLGVRTPADAMKAARLVYGMLGIDFEGRTDGGIVIRSCAFSRVYSTRACALVSGLDEGLLAGLTGDGGGRLEFACRITDGSERCEATFHFAGATGATGVAGTGSTACAADSSAKKDGQP